MKKFTAYMAAAIICLFTLVSCDDEPDSLGTSVSASVTSLYFDGEGASAQSITVTANGDWLATTPSWVTLSPNYGGWGETTVSVSVSDNTEDVTDDDGNTVSELAVAREGTVTIEGTDVTFSITITQDGDPDKEAAGVEHITIAEFCEKDDDSSVFWEVTGTVTSIVNTTYGNMYIEDETGSLYIYGTLDWDGNTKNFSSLGLEVGDEITLQGYKTTYYDTVEMVNGQPIEIVKASS